MYIHDHWSYQVVGGGKCHEGMDYKRSDQGLVCRTSNNWVNLFMFWFWWTIIVASQGGRDSGGRLWENSRRLHRPLHRKEKNEDASSTWRIYCPRAKTITIQHSVPVPSENKSSPRELDIDIDIDIDIFFLDIDITFLSRREHRKDGCTSWGLALAFDQEEFWKQLTSCDSCDSFMWNLWRFSNPPTGILTCDYGQPTTNNPITLSHCL